MLKGIPAKIHYMLIDAGRQYHPKGLNLESPKLKAESITDSVTDSFTVIFL